MGKPPCYMVDVDYQTLIRFSDKNGHWTNNPKHEFNDFSLISFRDNGVKFLMEPVEIFENDEIEIIWLSRDYMRQNTLGGESS